MPRSKLRPHPHCSAHRIPLVAQIRRTELITRKPYESSQIIFKACQKRPTTSNGSRACPLKAGYCPIVPVKTTKTVCVIPPPMRPRYRSFDRELCPWLMVRSWQNRSVYTFTTMPKFVVEFGKAGAPPAPDGRLDGPAFHRNHDAIW